MKRFYSSVILLGIGALIINTQVRFGDGCAGMIGGLSFMFFGFVYAVVFIAILVVENRKKALVSDYNVYPLVTTLIVIVAIVIVLNKDKFVGTPKLYAESNTLPGYSLTLKKNGRFTAAVHEIEWTCYYDGKYEISNDTLILSRHDMQELTDNDLSDIYLIDRAQNKMYPLDRLDRDTNFWLTIR